MLDGFFVVALGAGLVAALNPCGFALLPAYLTYFVGTGADDDSEGGVLRALKVSAVLTAGFVFVFGLWGLITTPFVISIQSQLPWVTIVIGIGLAVLGVAMLAGKDVTFSVPKLQRGGGGRELPSMFLFGVSYAVASLSCTIGPFLAVTTSAFNSADYLSGVALFVTYGLGMGLFVAGLTLAVALARTAIVNKIRGALQYVTRISGGLMIVAGLYVAWYGWWEVRINRGELVDDPLTGFGENVRTTVDGWIQDDIGAVRFAVGVGVILAMALGAVVARRVFDRTRTAPSVPAESSAAPAPAESSAPAAPSVSNAVAADVAEPA